MIPRTLLALTATALFTAGASAQDGLKIYISADMEGVVGVATADQLGPTGFEYGLFRQIMTNEVNAAIEAAREAGATEDPRLRLARQRRESSHRAATSGHSAHPILAAPSHDDGGHR